VKLLDLEPRWIHPNVFIFKCPHCQKDLLTCKNAVMPFQQQHDLFRATFGDDWPALIVGCNDEMAWTFSGNDFETLTVTPSLDASASGHWHGFITNGEIR
jgi:hypothetical protein